MSQHQSKAHKKHVKTQKRQLIGNAVFAVGIVIILLGGLYQSITSQQYVIGIIDELNDDMLSSSNADKSLRRLLELSLTEKEKVEKVENLYKTYKIRIYPLSPEDDWMRFPDTVMEE